MNFGQALGIEPSVAEPAAAGEQQQVIDQSNAPEPGAAPADIIPPVDNSQSQTPNTPPPAVVDPAAAPAPAIDYNKYLDEMSGGLIKDVDGFKAVLPKLSDYDTLKSEKERLAAEMAQAPKFADDEVRILNELKAAGATKEQIKSFHKINEYGSIAEMPDRDAIIAHMVINGTKQSTAELKVDRDFKLKDENLEPIDRELADEDMRIAAKAAREGLQKFKAEASSVHTIPPEEIQLQQQAALIAHQGKVTPYVKDVMASIPNLGTFELKGKDGVGDISYEIPKDEVSDREFSESLRAYYMDGLTPVTPETTLLALGYARAEYFRVHQPEILQAVYDKAVSLTEERMINKYENRSGLKPQKDNPIQPGQSDAAATAKFFSDKVNRVNS